MPTEQRVISTKPKIGARPPGAGAIGESRTPPEATEAKTKKKRLPKKVLLALMAVVVLLGSGAAYWFLLGPGGGTAEAVVEPEVVKGEVITVEPVSLNLAGGHYLRLGLGLQLVEGVEEAPDTARALDLAIALFSGHTVEEVSTAEARQAFKDELTHQLVEAYEGEVMAVYFTDYVTQ